MQRAANRAVEVTVMRLGAAVVTAALRGGLGVLLITLGVCFVVGVSGPGAAAGIPPVGGLWAHYVLIVLVGGGLLVMSGFFTRWAAVAQLPILAWSVLVFLYGSGDPTAVDPAARWMALVITGVLGP